MSPLTRSPSELQERADLAGTRAALGHRSSWRAALPVPGSQPIPCTSPCPLPLAPATSPNPHVDEPVSGARAMGRKEVAVTAGLPSCRVQGPCAPSHTCRRRFRRGIPG